MIKIKYIEPNQEKLIAIDIFEYIKHKYDVKLSVAVARKSSGNSFEIKTKKV